LDYDAKVRMLEQIAQELLDLRQEYAQTAGRAAQLRAEITVLNNVKGALQSALRAERES
jgi:cell division protein FtsB